MPLFKRKILDAFGCHQKDRLEHAEHIVSAFKTMLEVAHLSNNKSAACNYARQEIAEYERKYR